MYIESYVPNAFIALEQAGLIIIMEDILEHRIEASSRFTTSQALQVHACTQSHNYKHTVMFNNHAIRTTPSIYIHCTMYA